MDVGDESPELRALGAVAPHLRGMYLLARPVIGASCLFLRRGRGKGPFGRHRPWARAHTHTVAKGPRRCSSILLGLTTVGNKYSEKIHKDAKTTATTVTPRAENVPKWRAPPRQLDRVRTTNASIIEEKRRRRACANGQSVGHAAKVRRPEHM